MPARIYPLLDFLVFMYMTIFEQIIMIWEIFKVNTMARR